MMQDTSSISCKQKIPIWNFWIKSLFNITTCVHYFDNIRFAIQTKFFFSFFNLEHACKILKHTYDLLHILESTQSNVLKIFQEYQNLKKQTI